MWHGPIIVLPCADASPAAAGSSRRMTPTAGMPPPPKISGRGHSPAAANAKTADGAGHDAAAGKTVATGGPRAKVPLQHPDPEPCYVNPINKSLSAVGVSEALRAAQHAHAMLRNHVLTIRQPISLAVVSAHCACACTACTAAHGPPAKLLKCQSVGLVPDSANARPPVRRRWRATAWR